MQQLDWKRLHACRTQERKFKKNKRITESTHWCSDFINNKDYVCAMQACEEDFMINEQKFYYFFELTIFATFQF